MLTFAVPMSTSSRSRRGLSASLHDLVERLGHEGLLAHDAAEVGLRVAHPTVLGVVLGLARAGVGERHLAVERHAAELVDVQTGGAVAQPPVEVERHAADGVDEPPEPGEVDLDPVVHGDAEVLADRVDQHLLLAGGVVGRVDAVRLARAGDRHPQVAGEREDVHLLGLRVEAHHHDRVGALALDRRLLACAFALAAVAADQQEVHRLARGGVVGVDPDPVDAAPLVPAVRHDRRRQEADGRQRRARAEDAALTPGPPGTGAAPRRSSAPRRDRGIPGRRHARGRVPSVRQGAAGGSGPV